MEEQILPATEQQFTTAHSVIGAQRPHRSRTIYRRTQGIAAMFAVVTRADMAGVMTLPAVAAFAVAWWQSGQLNGLALFFTLLGVLATALGMNALVEYGDSRRSANEAASPREGLVTGALLIERNRVAATTARNLALLLLSISAICALWLTLLAGWPMLFFMGLMILLALTFAASPIHYGYRGWGVGELGLFVAFGLLPVVGAFYVQTHTLTWLPFWVSIPFGLLLVMASLAFNLMFYRRDWRIRKRTLVVELGPPRALDFSVVLLVVAFAAFLPIITLARLPLVTLIVLAALPLPLGAVGRLHRDDITVDECLPYYNAIMGAILLTTSLLGVALWVDKVF
ncbi:MAG: prenyltransferase [Caldilineaceae bacterium]|nr:prenyltransferase [Caldilineaceae bacterium]